jgi:hypothetical protein
MHKHTAAWPLFSAMARIADGTGLVITARSAAVLHFSWRVGRAALVRSEPGDLGAACYWLAEHWRWSDRWLFPPVRQAAAAARYRSTAPR